MSRKVVLGGVEYNSITAAKAHARKILKEAQLAAPVDPEHQPFLIDYFSRHHEWEAKCAGMFDHFAKVKSQKGTACFHVIRTDGTPIPISLDTPAHKAGAHDPKKDAKQAARDLVKDQVSRCRAEQSAGLCPICGQMLGSDSHVDHDSPMTFQFLLEDFLAERNQKIETIEVEQEQCGDLRFTDAGLGEDWQIYHYMHSNLRLICKSHNLSIESKIL